MQQQHLWKRRSFIMALCASVLGLGLVVYLLYLGYQVAWTGFSVPACSANQQCPSNKTLWDWLQLFVVPLALAGAGFWFSQVQKKTELDIAQKQKEAEQENAEKRYLNDQQIAKERYLNDQAISKDKQREDLLQAYLDRMSELLLKENLRTSQPDSEVRNVARVRTLTVLVQLDTLRKNHVLSFLREAKLVSAKPGESIVSFSQANMMSMNLKRVSAYDIDFSEANFNRVDLSEADFSGAYLREVCFCKATLIDAALNQANLDGADLDGANLIGAHLMNANLSFASLMAADLSKAILSESNLSMANLHKANLHKAYLDEVNLSGANLEDANLKDANLCYSNLSGANLKGANLSGANLSGANLKDSNIQQALNVTKEQLDKAKIVYNQPS